MSVRNDKPHHWYYHPTMGVSGIYGIFNRDNLKVYVGSAVDVLSRWHNHESQLKTNKHPNSYLQRAFNNNPTAFEFVEIEEIENKIDLICREQFWMDFYQSNHPDTGYNIRRKAESQLGYRFTPDQRKRLSEKSTGRKMSAEFCANLSDRMKIQRAKPENAHVNTCRIGIKCSPESIQQQINTKIKKGIQVRKTLVTFPNGDVKEYPMLTLAVAATGVKYRDVQRRLQQGREQCGNFIFERL